MLLCASAYAQAQQVNVYSARKEALIEPILDRFTQTTGIKVNLVTGKADGLITRMRSEGQLSPADLLITTDVGRLVRAKSQGLTQAYTSATINEVVPAHLRDDQAHWLALTLRARPIMYAIDRVKPEELSTLAALTQANWHGRICIRSSNNIYNQSMTAALILEQGEQATLNWAKGLVNNFARSPRGGDRDQIKAVAAGQCDIAIANTYYLAGMLTSDNPDEVKAAQAVKVFWPDQQGNGAHVNISGIAMAKHAKNSEQAAQLIDFMLSDEAQQWYAQTNHEYPVKAGVALSDTLKDMGDFSAQKLSLREIGEGNAAALKLMDNAGWK